MEKKRILLSIIALGIILLLAFSVSCTNDPPAPSPKEDTISYMDDPNEGKLKYIKRCIAPTEEEKKLTKGEGFGTTDDSEIAESNVLSNEMIDRIIYALKDTKNITTASNSDIAVLDLTIMTEKSLNKVKDKLKTAFASSEAKIENDVFYITAASDAYEYTYRHDSYGNLTMTATTGKRVSTVEYSVMKKPGDDRKDTFFRQEIKDGDEHYIQEQWYNAVENGETRSYNLTEDALKSVVTVNVENTLSDDIPDTIVRTTEKNAEGTVISDEVMTKKTLMFKDVLSVRTAETDLLRNALYNLEIMMSPTTREGQIKLSDDLKSLLPVNLNLTSTKHYTYTPDNSSHWIKFREDYFVWRIAVIEKFDDLVDTMTIAGYEDEDIDDANEYVTTGDGWKMLITKPQYGMKYAEATIQFNKEYLPTVW